MAVTRTNLFEGGGRSVMQRVGNPGDRIIEADFSVAVNTYTTNGVTLDVSDIFEDVLGYYCSTNNKAYYANIADLSSAAALMLEIYNAADATEVSNGTDLSALTVYIRIVGRM